MNLIYLYLRVSAHRIIIILILPICIPLRMQNVLGQRVLGALSIPATSMELSHFSKYQTSKKTHGEIQRNPTSIGKKVKSAFLKIVVARK